MVTGLILVYGRNVAAFIFLREYSLQGIEP